MEFIKVDQNNIEKEHICCAISDKKGETCVSSKKAWMKQGLEDGLVFLKLDVRGKVFIEYMPAEHAWYPIQADGYMHINCFWIAGQYKGQGYGNQLLDRCIEDAKSKGRRGLTVIASEKKRSFLPDAGYLKHRGFVAADTAKPYFVLYYLPFTEDAPAPRFKECAKEARTDEMGMALYYTNQCPHTDKYVPLIEAAAKERGAAISVHKFNTAAEAQNAPAAFTTYGFFYDGEFVTNEILSEKKFTAFMNEHGM